MRTLIVDDERVARNRLRRMVERLGGLEVVGEAADGAEALERVAALDPELIFLDIRMPEIDGLELARLLPESIRVIFTTAYDEYAVAAFEAAAIDYLLKPIEAERLAKAVEKARKYGVARPPGFDELLERLTGKDEPPRVTARRGDTLRIFDAREISRFHAEDRYTVFRHEAHDYLLDESIVALEERLAGHGFARVHRGELVNLQMVRALQREDDQSYVQLSDGQRASVSRRHLRGLKEQLGIPTR